MFIKALVDLKPGDEITIAYVDPMLDCKTRKEILDSRYFFTCSCRLCDLESSIQQKSIDSISLTDFKKDCLEFATKTPFDYEKQSQLNRKYHQLVVSNYTTWSLQSDQFIDVQNWSEAAQISPLILSCQILKYPSFHPMIAIQSLLTAQVLWNGFGDLNETRLVLELALHCDFVCFDSTSSRSFYLDELN